MKLLLLTCFGMLHESPYSSPAEGLRRVGAVLGAGEAQMDIFDYLGEVPLGVLLGLLLGHVTRRGHLDLRGEGPCLLPEERRPSANPLVAVIAARRGGAAPETRLAELGSAELMALHVCNALLHNPGLEPVEALAAMAQRACTDPAGLCGIVARQCPWQKGHPEEAAEAPAEEALRPEATGGAPCGLYSYHSAARELYARLTDARRYGEAALPLRESFGCAAAERIRGWVRGS